MWTAIRRRTRQRSKGPRHYVLGAFIVLWALLVIFVLVRSFFYLPATLQLSQRCRMSRMWPSYIPYDTPSPSGLNKKYRLFLYREAYPGRQTSEDDPSGRPALFIPGNAGSFGQVRSVASSAHHLYESKQGGDGVVEVDWWTVDFNEDFSAFHGQTMHDQAEYINEVLGFLLKKYSSTNHIPILAHSMGGIVARLMMLKDSHPAGSVETIITLSSPHAYPPVPLDGGVEEVYNQINAFWEKTAHNTLLISLSGGILDNQLSSEPASLPLARLWYGNTSLSAFTSSMPALWSGVDHLAMMWCDQLRERVARGVLRIEGRETKLKEKKEEWRRMLGMEQNGQEVPLSSDNLPPPDDSEGHTVSTFAIADAGLHHVAFELVVDLPVGLDSSFGPPIDQYAQIRVDLCSRNTESIVSCRHVLPSAYDLYPPSPRIKQEVDEIPLFPIAEERYEAPGHGLRRLQISLDQLNRQQIDHIRVERKITSYGLVLAGWMESNTTIVDYSSILRSIFVPLEKGPGSISPSKSTIVTGMDSSLLAYDMTILGSNHVDPSCHSNVAPMLRAQSMSTGDTQYYPSIWPGSKHPLTLHSTSPFMPPAIESSQGTEFTLLLDSCSQISGVSIRINWKTSLGLLLSRYRSALGSFPIAALLLLMSVMWEEWDQGAPFPSSSTVAIQYAPFLAPLLVLVSVLLSGIQRVAALRSLSSQDLLPPSLQNLTFGIANSPLLSSTILGFIFLTSAYGLCLLVSFFLDVLVWLLTSLIRITGVKAGFNTMEQGRDDIMHLSRSTLVSFFILAVIVWLAVPVQFVFLVLFLIQLYFAVQSNLAAQNKKGGDTSRAKQQVLFLNLYFWLLPSTAPALLIWTRNLVRGYYGVLGGPDHNILYVIGFLAISQISSSGDVLQRNRSRSFSFVSRSVMLGFSVLSIAYGIRYTYLLLQFANIVTAWLAFAHFLDRKRTKETSSPLLDEQDEEEREPLKMQIDMHSTFPDSIEGRDSLPESLVGSLQGQQEGYIIKDTGKKEVPSNSKDILLERYLDTLDEYFACKKQISENFSSGHFQLSKARMQLGRLASLNEGWDARMKTTWAVRIQDDGGTRIERIRPISDEKDEEEGVLIEEKGISSLRRRKGADPIAEKVGEVSEKEKKNKNKKKGQPFDPLYQFTALPPPSLRQAQNKFSAALIHLVDGKGSKSVLQLENELKHLENLIEQEK